MSTSSSKDGKKLWNLICGVKEYRSDLNDIKHEVIEEPKRVTLGNYRIRSLGNYSIEKIVLGAPKDDLTPAEFEHIPCFILKPEDKEEPENGFPAVICLHQHKGDYTVGKSEVVGLTQKVLSDEYYDYGVKLVKKGFVVIAPDFKCFEERRSREFEARSKYDAKTAPEVYERFVAMNYLLQGTTFQRRMILDIKSVFDYLSKREDVNKEQIGCIGHSLGGTEAIFAAALIPEIKAAVASCGISTYRAIQEMYVNHNFAFYIPGFLQEFGDIGEVLDLLKTNQSLLILAGEKDQNFPEEGVKELCENRNDFHEINDKDITNCVEYNSNRSFYWIQPEKKHEFSPEMQKEAIKFLREKLR